MTTRKLNTTCSVCGEKIYRRPAELKFERHYYCSSCRSAGQSRSAHILGEEKYKEFIKDWLAGKERGISDRGRISEHVRRFLFEKYGGVCCRCGWAKTNPFTDKVSLEIHHIDGDWKNNTVVNLELLCPNCHSLTKSYKGANKGQGRLKRTESPLI